MVVEMGTGEGEENGGQKNKGMVGMEVRVER